MPLRRRDTKIPMAASSNGKSSERMRLTDAENPNAPVRRQRPTPTEVGGSSRLSREVFPSATPVHTPPSSRTRRSRTNPLALPPRANEGEPKVAALIPPSVCQIGIVHPGPAPRGGQSGLRGGGAGRRRRCRLPKAGWRKAGDRFAPRNAQYSPRHRAHPVQFAGSALPRRPTALSSRRVDCAPAACICGEQTTSAEARAVISTWPYCLTEDVHWLQTRQAVVEEVTGCRLPTCLSSAAVFSGVRPALGDVVLVTALFNRAVSCALVAPRAIEVENHLRCLLYRNYVACDEFRPARPVPPAIDRSGALLLDASEVLSTSVSGNSYAPRAHRRRPKARPPKSRA